MDRKGDLSKISSSHILNCILKYVQYEDENFCLQLFKYSKDYQKKFGICLFDYKKKYIKNLQIFSLKKYLSYKHYHFKKFDLNILKKTFQKDLEKSKLNEEELIKYLIDYYNRLFQNKITPKNEESLIDVHSPLFEPFSKEKYFEEIFTIPISIQDDEAYINAFSKLNSNYPKLDLSYKNVDDIDYLEKIKINFSLLKRLNLQPEGDVVINNYSLLNSLFSLPNIKNNLIYLEIKGTFKEDEKPHFHFGHHNVEEVYELKGSLNDFTSLEVLKLTSFAFIELFTLKTSNLKELYLENCKNISFEGGQSLNLKKLSLHNNIIIEPKIKIIAPELEELSFFGDYCHIFNFNSLVKLNNLNIEQFNIENYKNSPLKYISIERSNLSNEKQNIEKLISIRTLEKITIRLSGITDDEISKIKEKNYFVENLNISWANQKCDCEIYNLLSKFPNTTNLEITSKNIYDNNLSTLEIKENPELKINKISISGQNKNIKLYIESFENLKYIFLNFINEIKNIEDTFPFFRNICNTEFKSLNFFEFRYNTRTPESKTNNAAIINNLYKSLDKMPYLQTFILSCSTKGVKVEFYEKLIQKLLSLRLKKIEMDIQNDLNLKFCKYYTKNELQKIYPKKSCFGFENITICKLK